MSDNIYNILQKINDVEPVHQPQIDSTIEKVEPQSDFVKSVTELEKKYQVFKEDATPKRRIMDFDNHSLYWGGTGKYQDQYSKLYDKLVPSEGKSDTVEGELLRAVGKIIYRHGNDGDNFSNGSYEWIEKHVGKFDHLDDMADKVVLYVLNKKGDYTPNNVDWVMDIADYGPGEHEKDWAQVGCQNCGGTGEIEYENDDGEEEYEECDYCDGNGWIEQTSESINEAKKEKEKKSVRLQPDDIDLSRGEPDVVKLVNKARLERPAAQSDAEALAYQMVKTNQELDKAEAELDKATALNNKQEKELDKLADKINKVSSKQVPGAEEPKTQAPKAQAQAKAKADAPSLNVVQLPKADAEVPAKAQAKVQTDPRAVVKTEPEVTKQKVTTIPTKKTTKVEPKPKPAYDPGAADLISKQNAKAKAKQSTDDFIKGLGIDDAANDKEYDKVAESKELNEQLKEGDPKLADFNYKKLIKAFRSGVQRISLSLPTPYVLYDYQAYAILFMFSTIKNTKARQQKIEELMASKDAIVNYLQSEIARKYIQEFPNYVKKIPAYKKRTRDIDRNKFELEPGPGDWQVGEIEKSLKRQTQENLGNNTMQDNTKSNGILEGVRRVEEGTELKNKTDFDDNAKTGDYYITSKGHKVTKTKSGIKHDRKYKDEKEKDDMDESVQFSDTIENSKAELEVVKESNDVRNHPIYTNEEAWDHYQKEVTEQENEEVVDVNDELNEIARLAGLNNEEVTVGGNEVKGLWSDWTEKDQEDDMEEACGMSKKMKEGFDPDDFEGEIEMDGKTITYHADVDKEQNKVKVTKCSDEDYKEACQADAEAEWDARDADVPMDEEVVAEGPTRKDFQMVADLLKDNPNMADRKAKAKDYCDKFKAMNPRFDKEKFMKACGIEETIEEDTVEEGNEFTKARLDAIKAGKDSFTVDGKTYKVSGDTSQEKMNEDIHVQVTVDNEQDALNLLRKLSGMPEETETETETEDMSPVGSNDPCSACDCDPCGCDEAVEEERDIELANTPNEKVAPVSAVTTDAGGGLNGPKKQYPLAANPSDNPIEEDLWKAYETMVDEVKKATNED